MRLVIEINFGGNDVTWDEISDKLREVAEDVSGPDVPTIGETGSIEDSEERMKGEWTVKLK